MIQFVFEIEWEGYVLIILILGFLLLKITEYVLKVRDKRKLNVDSISNSYTPMSNYELEVASQKEFQKFYDKIFDGVDFLNKNTITLEKFVINDDINKFDLHKLAQLNNIKLEIASGWFDLVIELIKELNSNGWDKQVSCIKEKYAELRFYSNTEQQDLIEEYEIRSTLVCETCGEEGEIRYNSDWDFVACDLHKGN